jgi:cobalamin biosynthesis protein CobD/CbiB
MIKLPKLISRYPLTPFSDFIKFRGIQDTHLNKGSTMKLFAPLLTALFIGLKLTGYIAWSWWWVLSPIWIPWAIFILFLAIVFAIKPLRESFMAGVRNKYQQIQNKRLVDMLVNKDFNDVNLFKQ